MIGLLYIVLTFVLGWAICSIAFPKLDSMVETDCLKRKISVSPYILLLPAWYVTGTLSLTWVTYLLAYLCKDAGEPLLYANGIAMPLAFLFSVLIYLMKKRSAVQGSLRLLSKDRKSIRIELALLFAVIVLAGILMWTTFFVNGDKLYVGVSVFSDFSPHVGMIRSFSFGNNFPTTYPHFAGEDIKYHFMFQFLAGNLEYLGLRIDYAFNLPSMISFVCAFLLLYLLAVKITGNKAAGVLACTFFAFRSSKTLFTYLTDIPKGTGIWKALTENTNFISSTPNEDWGLWNLNVYCNQRHLAFGLTAMFFILLLFLPHLYAMFEDIKKYHLKNGEHKKKQEHKNSLKKLAGQIKVIFFTKQGWEVIELRTAIASGVLLGSLSFFHGAAVIGVLAVLFVMAILSRRRLEYVIMAVLTLSLSLL
ncbi:MAG: putative rane protein, partial [Herbinix sp.]|nr:putative rane protein [Herbinix sp.]